VAFTGRITPGRGAWGAAACVSGRRRRARAARRHGRAAPRVLVAHAVVLVGGRKRGQDKRFYREHVRKVDAIYDRYLRTLNRERDAGRSHER
jgi:hypothetical protein